MRHIHRDWVCCLLLAENIASAHEHHTIVRPQAPRSHCERSLRVGALAQASERKLPRHFHASYRQIMMSWTAKGHLVGRCSTAQPSYNGGWPAGGNKLQEACRTLPSRTKLQTWTRWRATHTVRATSRSCSLHEMPCMACHGAELCDLRCVRASKFARACPC